MSNTTCELSEEQVLAALAIVATPVGAAALLSEWHERVVTAEDVSQAIAASPRLQRITSVCRSVQSPTSVKDVEARIRALVGPRRRLGPPARK
jgi:hypothetical protein